MLNEHYKGELIRDELQKESAKLVFLTAKRGCILSTSKSILKYPLSIFNKIPYICIKIKKMKLLIDVEEAQIDFMLDLLSKFDFVKIDTDDEELTDDEKGFIESRLLHH